METIVKNDNLAIRKNLTKKTYSSPPTHDSKDVVWFEGDEKVGSGYQSKASGTVCVIRCPMCEKENYGPLVASGRCVWCGFDANI